MRLGSTAVAGLPSSCSAADTYGDTSRPAACSISGGVCRTIGRSSRLPVAVAAQVRQQTPAGHDPAATLFVHQSHTAQPLKMRPASTHQQGKRIHERARLLGGIARQQVCPQVRHGARWVLPLTCRLPLALPPSDLPSK